VTYGFAAVHCWMQEKDEGMAAECTPVMALGLYFGTHSEEIDIQYILYTYQYIPCSSLLER
jgi:hypothetical protein